MDDSLLKPLNIEECVELFCSHLDDSYKDAFRKRLSMVNSAVCPDARQLYQYEGNLIGVGFLAGIKADNDDTMLQLKKANGR